MENLLSNIEKIRAMTEAEWVKYRNAIRENRPFEEIKIIYMHIKELQSQINKLTDDVQQKLINN